MYLDNYPYTDFHEMNMDSFINEVAYIKNKLDTIYSQNKINIANPIEHSIGTEYKGNTIVKHLNKTYLSVKDVPLGVPVTDVEYWIEIGDLSSIESELQTQIDAINNPYSQKHFTIYVNSTLSDDNDGLTPETAVKTIDKALDIMAKHADGAYIRIVSSGTYICNYPVISGCMIHWMFDASNVTLQFGASDESYTKAFYNDYWHFEGNEDGTSVVAFGGTHDAYFEGSRCYAFKIKFTSTNTPSFGVFGGSCLFSSCEFALPIRLSSTSAVLTNITYRFNSALVTDVVEMLQAYNNTIISFTGNQNFIIDSGSPDVFLYTSRAKIYLQTDFPTIAAFTNAHAVQLNRTEIIGTWTRVGKLCNNFGGVPSISGCVVNGQYIYELEQNIKTFAHAEEIYTGQPERNEWLTLPRMSQYFVKFTVTSAEASPTEYTFYRPLVMTSYSSKQRLDFDCLFGAKGYLTVRTNNSYEIRYEGSYISLNDGSPISNSDNIVINGIYGLY